MTDSPDRECGSCLDTGCRNTVNYGFHQCWDDDEDEPPCGPCPVCRCLGCLGSGCGFTTTIGPHDCREWNARWGYVLTGQVCEVCSDCDGTGLGPEPTLF